MHVPRAMREAPALDPSVRPGPARRRHALLLNPFYAKDPHASFGKHVLTPSLALTSIAAATPPGWTVRYFDENLLQGAPPWQPFPRSWASRCTSPSRGAPTSSRTGIASGARRWCSAAARAVCPEECSLHADAIAVGEGVQLWGSILRDFERGELKRWYVGSYARPYRDEPPPRRDILPRDSFLTTTSLIATRGCHNRCGFCYLATDGLNIPYQMRDVEQVAQEFAADGQPYAVFVDNNLGSRPEYLRRLCRALRPPREDLERGDLDRHDRRSLARARDGARRLHRRLRRLRVARGREHRRRAQEEPAAGGLRAPRRAAARPRASR
jgi:hypothetical protein